MIWPSVHFVVTCEYLIWPLCILIWPLYFTVWPLHILMWPLCSLMYTLIWLLCTLICMIYVHFDLISIHFDMMHMSTTLIWLCTLTWFYFWLSLNIVKYIRVQQIYDKKHNLYLITVPHRALKHPFFVNWKCLKTRNIGILAFYVIRGWIDHLSTLLLW